MGSHVADPEAQTHCILLTERTDLKIQIRSDNNINVSDQRATELEDIVKKALRHCSNHITRIEMHLSDVNGGKPGQQDKSCVMEARMERRQPVAVTELADTVGASVSGAAEKLERLVKSTLGRDAANRPTAPVPDPLSGPDIEQPASGSGDWQQ